VLRLAARVLHEEQSAPGPVAGSPDQAIDPISTTSDINVALKAGSIDLTLEILNRLLDDRSLAGITRMGDYLIQESFLFTVTGDLESSDGVALGDFCRTHRITKDMGLILTAQHVEAGVLIEGKAPETYMTPSHLMSNLKGFFEEYFKLVIETGSDTFNISSGYLNTQLARK